MQEGQWLIAVTAGRWQRHGIREARAAGLKVLAIDTDPNAEGFVDADQALVFDFSDYATIIQTVHDLDKNIQGAVSFCSEAGMALAAHIREEFDLPGPHSEVLNRVLNKAIQRKIWAQKGVPGPRWEVFQNKNDALTAIPDFGFPLIIKPADSSGSRGVVKLESVNDDILGSVIRAFQFSNSNEILLETYMDGVEFTVEIFATKGNVHVLAVTEKKKVKGTRGTVAYELATPDRPHKVIMRIAEAAVAAYTALGYSDGPGHAEVILKTDGSVGLVEVAGRGGGFMVFDRFVPAVSGVNIARLTALQAVGCPVEIGKSLEQAAVLRFFPSRQGVLRGISGFEIANLIEGVEAEPFVSVGHRLYHSETDGDRLGFILSRARTPQHAQKLADKAEHLISFDIEETL